MAVIIGLEGVLARHEWRLPLIESDGWEKYHSEMMGDGPNHPMIQMAAALHAKGQTVICICTRPRNYYMATKTWMVKHGVMVDDLLTRGEKDFRQDAELRKALLAQAQEKHGEILLAIDESEKACDVYRAAGITTLQLTNPQGEQS